MAHSANQVIEALGRAVCHPEGLPLFGNRTTPGLFGTSSSARQAAQRCKEADLLRVLRSESRGKAVQEICALTEKGADYLVRQVEPAQLLHSLVQACEQSQARLQELTERSRRIETGLAVLREAALKVMEKLPAAPSANGKQERNGTHWIDAMLAHLARRHDAGIIEDCSLADLYRSVRQSAPELTIGQFHDGLRRLLDEQKIYLHPWTGPLYDLPDPAFALLVGHEIAYYASRRQ